jgi:hypothetical protein
VKAMKKISIAFVFSLLVAGTISADHHYTDWNEYFAGSWELEDGSHVQDFKLAAGGHALVGTGKSATGEEFVWVMGWDPAEKTVIHEWFGKDHGRITYQIVDDKVLRGTGVISSATELVKANVTLTKKDDKEYTVKWTDVTMNGKKVDDIVAVVKKK